MLTRLIYYSTVAKIDGISEINKILEKSKDNNAERSVTGMLFFNEKYFIQVLEGDRKKVTELMLKIAQDDRHSDIVLVDVSEIGERKFHGWEMVYAGRMKMDNQTLMRFAPHRKFDPDELTTDNFKAMIDYFYDQLTAKK